MSNVKDLLCNVFSKHENVSGFLFVLIKNRFMTLLAITSSVLACSMNSAGEIVLDPPHCTIISQSELLVTSYGSSTMEFVVENDGDGDVANNIHVSVKLKKGNFIVDESLTYFGSLKKGESKSEKARFSKLESASDYTSIEVELYWEDSYGGIYGSN